MDRRIAPPGQPELKRALEKLTSPQPGHAYSVFETKQKALTFAAALGRHLGLRLGLNQRDTGAAIRFDIFQKALDEGFIHALAVDTTSDLKVLDEKRADDVATVFEEYALGGLQEINRCCFEGGADPLDVLLAMAADARDAEMDEEMPAGMDPAVFRNLLG